MADIRALLGVSPGGRALTGRAIYKDPDFFFRFPLGTGTMDGAWRLQGNRVHSILSV